MLTHLMLRNFVTIAELNLTCSSGLTVITGETGAGKSILFDALNLLTGARAQPSWVRDNESQAELSAHFEIKPDSPAEAWLQAQSYNDGSDCIVRRTIKKDGRSKIYINGHMATLQELKTLSQWLINIHGQHESHALTEPDTQRALLDAFANHSPLCHKVKEAFSGYAKATKELATLLENAQKQEDKKALFSYQLKELQAIHLDSDEIASIETSHKEMAHAETALVTLHEVHQKINGDQALSDELNHCLVRIESLLPHFDALQSAYNMLQEAETLITEANHIIGSIAERLDFTPEAFEALETRLSVLHQIARKHKTNIPGLIELQQNLENELQSLSQLSEDIAQAESNLQEKDKVFKQLAQQLHSSRLEAAHELRKKIIPILRQLHMPHADFDVTLEPKEASQYGVDKINYLIKTNLGQKLDLLGQIASGGELSRASLAIEILTHAASATPIIVFDEVDVGISGETAITVGKLLQQLASRCQVLCITHLPQVAAAGHQHWQVTKRYSDQQTFSEVEVLTPAGREKALATLLSGKVDKETQRTAQKMLAEALSQL